MSEQDPDTIDEAAREHAKAEAAQQQAHQRMLDLAVRHLYGTALTLCRLTGGTLSDVPRILVATGEHSVQSLIEKLAAQQKRLESLPPEHAGRDGLIAATTMMADDLTQTMNDFEGALIQALANMKSLRELEEEPQAAPDLKPDAPGEGGPVH